MPLLEGFIADFLPASAVDRNPVIRVGTGLWSREDAVCSVLLNCRDTGSMQSLCRSDNNSCSNLNLAPVLSKNVQLNFIFFGVVWHSIKIADKTSSVSKETSPNLIFPHVYHLLYSILSPT